MVGRLIEQQYVGILRQRARDRGAAALTARGSGSGAREIDTDLIGDRFGRMALGRVIAAEDVIEKCLAAREIGFLFEQYDARAGLDRAAALVGVDDPGERLEEGRLARAVAAEDRKSTRLNSSQ